MASYDRLKYRQAGIGQLILNKLAGRGPQLGKHLQQYRTYLPPHAGPASELTASQAEENFAYFKQERSNRLSQVTKLLSCFDIQLDPLRPDRHSLMQLDEWAYQQWPSIYRQSLVSSNIYSFAVSEGDAAIRAMLFDLGVLLGECFLSLQPDAQWFIDTSSVSRAEQRPSCNRIVLLLPPKPGQPEGWHDVADMESQVFYHYGLQLKPNPLLVADQKIGRVLAEPVLRLLPPLQFG